MADVVIKFNVDSSADDVFDQYVVWRLKDIVRLENDPTIKGACEEIIAYMEPLNDIE